MKGSFAYHFCWTAARIVAFFAIPIFFPHKIEGRENLPKAGPLILVANHVTWADPVYLAKMLLPRKSACLAKAELFEKGGRAGAWFLRHMGAIPVQRGTSDMGALKAALKAIKDDKPFYIFPEGTRNVEADGTIAPFNTGVGFLALMSKAPVYPVYFDYRKNEPRRQRMKLRVGGQIDLEEYHKGAPNSEKIHAATTRMEQALGDLREKAM